MMTNYKTVSDAQPTVETRVPIGPSRFETHVKVPVALAGIVALAVTFGLAIGTWRFDWPWDATWIGGLVTFIAMLAWRLLWVDQLSWRLERLTGLELDGKPGIGRPDPELTIWNADAAKSMSRQMQMPNHDAAQARVSLTSFVYLAASVDRPTEEALGIPTGDRAGYVKYRDRLIYLGIAAWNDPTRHAAGWHLCVAPENAAQIIDRHFI
jgi:hypothetical protein